MGAIAAFILRWGRVVAAYVLFVAAVAVLVNAVSGLADITIPSYEDCLVNAHEYMVDAADDMVAAAAQDEDSLGALLYYCFGLETAIDCAVTVLDVVISVFAALTVLVGGMVSCLAFRWVMRKLVWSGNALSGSKVGD